MGRRRSVASILLVVGALALPTGGVVRAREDSGRSPGAPEQRNLDADLDRLKQQIDSLESGKHRAVVQQNYDERLAAGVRGTPSFFLGKTRPDETIEGILMGGVRSTNEFRQEIDRLLNWRCDERPVLKECRRARRP